MVGIGERETGILLYEAGKEREGENRRKKEREKKGEEGEERELKMVHC